MKNRFALPAAIAVTLEAVLLLGFNRPSTASAQPPRLATVTLPDPVTPEDPDAAVPDDSEREPGPRRAQASSVSLPEPPPAPDSPGIRVPVPAAPAPAVIRSDRIEFGPPGSGPGVGDGGLLPAGMLDKTPRALSQRSPVYPSEAVRSLRQGEVLVEFGVDEAGRVFAPRIISSTSSVFDEPALRAVSQWRFEPGRRDGLPVRFRMRVPVEFHLDRE
jgi:protein TonB